MVVWQSTACVSGCVQVQVKACLSRDCTVMHYCKLALFVSAFWSTQLQHSQLAFALFEYSVVQLVIFLLPPLPTLYPPPLSLSQLQLWPRLQVY